MQHLISTIDAEDSGRDSIAFSALSDRISQDQVAMKAAKDESGSETGLTDEPDNLEAASMLLTAIHDVLSKLMRIASTIHHTAGHFSKRLRSSRVSESSKFQAVLGSSSGPSQAALSSPQVPETHTAVSPKTLQAGSVHVPSRFQE